MTDASAHLCLSSSTPSAEERTYARDKFATQKGISSDQYFGRGSYDPAAATEAQSRLREFSGASAISSSQYFGRDEDEEATERGLGGDLEGEGLDGLERAARDLAGRVLANPDVQALGDSIRSGALKVRFAGSFSLSGLIADVVHFAALRLPCVHGPLNERNLSPSSHCSDPPPYSRFFRLPIYTESPGCALSKIKESRVPTDLHLDSDQGLTSSTAPGGGNYKPYESRHESIVRIARSESTDKRTRAFGVGGEGWVSGGAWRTTAIP